MYRMETIRGVEKHVSYLLLWLCVYVRQGRIEYQRRVELPSDQNNNTPRSQHALKERLQVSQILTSLKLFETACERFFSFCRRERAALSF